jgi:hypothetical protein
MRAALLRSLTAGCGTKRTSVAVCHFVRFRGEGDMGQVSAQLAEPVSAVELLNSQTYRSESNLSHKACHN